MTDEVCDVAIIGAGAAGSTLAFMLARKGHSVIVLERGGRHDPTTFEHNEYATMPRLYKAGGPQSTADNDISFLQGEAVGGSTVINNAIWLRADLDQLLPRWHELGANLDRARIEQAYQELEQWLHVEAIPEDLVNAGTRVFMDGCRALGLKPKILSHNRQQCTGCGWCNYGCRYNRKASALVTFVPWAEELGARFLDRCEDVLLLRTGTCVSSLRCTRHGAALTVKAKRVVVASGAIGSTDLLLRNDITVNGRVGERFHAFGGVLVLAEMPQVLDGYDKIGLCAAAIPDHRRFVLETFFSPPGSMAVTLTGFGQNHSDRMKRFKYMAQAGAMIGTGAHGKLTRQKGRLKIELVLNDQEIRDLREGIKQLASAYLRAGAESVYPGTFRDLVLKNAGDVSMLDDAIKKAGDITFGSAHPQGGNMLSDDAAIGVVDSHFRVRGFDNLSVVDASVIPENLWANCQATVMALAHVASDSVGEGL